MGNGTTLSNSNSIWQKIVEDTWDRGCFFNVKDDKELLNAIFKPEYSTAAYSLHDLFDTSIVQNEIFEGEMPATSKEITEELVRVESLPTNIINPFWPSPSGHA